MARIETEEKVAQVLEKYRAGNSFSVPDGYFATLPDQVMDRVRASESHRFLFRRRLIIAVSVAASLILIVGIGLLWNSFQNDGTAVENMTATVVKKPVPTPAAAENSLPENALAQAVIPEQASPAPAAGKKTAQSKDDLLEKKADDFVGKFADEELDVIDYEILDYFSEEDYISFFLES